MQFLYQQLLMLLSSLEGMNSHFTLLKETPIGLILSSLGSCIGSEVSIVVLSSVLCFKFIATDWLGIIYIHYLHTVSLSVIAGGEEIFMEEFQTEKTELRVAEPVSTVFCFYFHNSFSAVHSHRQELSLSIKVAMFYCW